MTTQTVASLAWFSTLVVACGSDPSQPSADMKIYYTCIETQCEQITDTANASCNACLSACSSASYDCDPACPIACETPSCDSAEQNDCLEQGYQVTLPNNPSAAVNAACDDELNQITTCGYTAQMTPGDCHRYAATELPSVAASYECVAQLPCSSLADASALQACNLPASTVGDVFCGSFAAACPELSCSSVDQSALDADGGWMRADALAALNTCLSQPCDQVPSCAEAWRSAVE